MKQNNIEMLKIQMLEKEQQRQLQKLEDDSFA
jgi:hypothetical protein